MLVRALNFARFFFGAKHEEKVANHTSDFIFISATMILGVIIIISIAIITLKVYMFLKINLHG